MQCLLNTPALRSYFVAANHTAVCAEEGGCLLCDLEPLCTKRQGTLDLEVRRHSLSPVYAGHLQ